MMWFSSEAEILPVIIALWCMKVFGITLHSPEKMLTSYAYAAKNASKELYAYMMSETSETPRYSLLFPSISTAYYGDDLTIGGSCAYSYGYAVYAPQNIAEQILAKTQECKPIQLNNDLKL